MTLKRNGKYDVVYSSSGRSISYRRPRTGRHDLGGRKLMIDGVVLNGNQIRSLKSVLKKAGEID
jgi:hypothetical protein